MEGQEVNVEGGGDFKLSYLPPEEPKIDKLVAALSKFQGEMGGAEKDGRNHHFKNGYSTLSSVIIASKDLLAKNGLSIAQTMIYEGEDSFILTTLYHISGQKISSAVKMMPYANMQQMGSAMTYAKRYGWQSILGLPSLDDDGEAAVGRGLEAKNKTNNAAKSGGFIRK